MPGQPLSMAAKQAFLVSLKKESEEIKRLAAHRNDMERLAELSDEHCRKILTILCETDADIKKKTFSCLCAYKDSDNAPMLAPIVTPAEQDSTSGTKRKADDAIPELYICKKCGEGYLEEDNADEACLYHPEYLECDYDSPTWYDWPNGGPDTEENRKLYPKGFRWACCEERGDDDGGCEDGRHEPTLPKRQRPLPKASTTPKPTVTVDLTESD